VFCEMPSSNALPSMPWPERIGLSPCVRTRDMRMSTLFGAPDMTNAIFVDVMRRKDRRQVASAALSAATEAYSRVKSLTPHCPRSFPEWPGSMRSIWPLDKSIRPETSPGPLSGMRTI